MIAELFPGNSGWYLLAAVMVLGPAALAFVLYVDRGKGRTP